MRCSGAVVGRDEISYRHCSDVCLRRQRSYRDIWFRRRGRRTIGFLLQRDLQFISVWHITIFDQIKDIQWRHSIEAIRLMRRSVCFSVSAGAFNSGNIITWLSRKPPRIKQALSLSRPPFKKITTSREYVWNSSHSRIKVCLEKAFVPEFANPDAQSKHMLEVRPA